MLRMAPSTGRGAYPGAEQVKTVAAIEDSVIRNLRITQSYAELSAAVRSLIGEGANWCTFATWASRQAGCTIRGEDLGDRLGDALHDGWSLRHPVRSLWRALLRRGLFNPKTTLGRIVRAIHSPFDVFERASEAVAIGNRKVFEEIGYEMARYLDFCAHDPSPDSPRFVSFLEGLKAGPPPDGQEWLARAFTHYQRQRSEPQASRRAQLMLLANLEIGYHEQTRLQPEIQQAMEAGPETAWDLKRRLIGRFPAGRLLLLLTPFAAIAERYRRFACDVTRRIVSEALMVLRMPDRTLSLGTNLDAPVPAALGVLDEPELVKLVGEIEPSGPACEACGAEDWANLNERIHYILHLFRAFHAATILFDAPFSVEQVHAFEAGRIPPGRL